MREVVTFMAAVNLLPFTLQNARLVSDPAVNFIELCTVLYKVLLAFTVFFLY